MEIENQKKLLPNKAFPKSMWGFAAVILISVVIILIFLSMNRFNTFQTDINGLMETSAMAASREIEATLKDLRRDVTIFAAEHAELFAKIYRDKDIESREYRNLTYILEKRVPNMSSFNISNEEGSQLLNDFNKHIGQLDKIDIQNFVLNTFKQSIRMHPHANGFHFDIMVPFVGFNNEILVFIVNFVPTEINRILGSYANPNYDLIISSTLDQGLIEITKDGSRDIINGSYYLTNKDISSSIPIENTFWEVTVITEEGIYTNYIKNLAVDATILLALFTLICSPMFIILRKQFIKRQLTLIELEDSQNRFFDLYEYAPDIYMTITEDGVIKLANKYAREFFTKNGSSIAGNSIFELLDANSIEDVKEQIKKMYRFNILESQIEFIRNKKLGDYAILDAKMRLTPSTHEKKRYVRIVCREITKQKKESTRNLEHAQSQRDALVREVHHRIKNNLQNVISLLKTYARKNPNLQTIISDASSKIRSISEAYGLQSKSVNSAILVVDLVNSIIENERKLFLTQFNLNVDPELKDDGIIIEREITPIAVIISELITNAIKHGEKSGGAAVIKVKLHKKLGSVYLDISNNIATDALNSPTFNKITSGQGLKLIESLLPPKGATLKHKQLGQQMITTLILDSPYVINFDTLQKSALAV